MTIQLPNTTTEYLKSVLNPFDFKAGIPNNDNTTAILKCINISKTVPAQGSGEGLFLIRPHQRKDWAVDHYVWSEVEQQYVFRERLDYSEALSENFDLVRHVSSGYRVQSSTRSGGTIDLSGIFNAVHYQALPDLQTLKFEEIPSFKRNPVDVIAGVNVEEGIVSVTTPNSDHVFGPISERDAIRSTTIKTACTNSLTSPSSFKNLTGITSSPVFIFDAADNPGFIPPNWIGDFEIFFQGTVTGVAGVPATGSSMGIEVLLNYKTINSSDVVTFLVSSFFMDANILNGVSQHITGRFRVFEGLVNTTDAPLFSIAIRANLSTVGSANLSLVYLEMQSPEYLEPGYLGPGALVAYQGVTTGQEITIAGVANYEVVPDSNLSRQLPTSYPAYNNPLEMQMVEAYVAGLGKHGGRMLWNYPAYMMFKTSPHFANLTSEEFAAEASGFGDFFRRIWGYVKPAIVKYAPIVGGALAGPEGALMGTGISAMTKAYGAGRRSKIAGIGYASGFGAEGVECISPDSDQDEPFDDPWANEMDFDCCPTEFELSYDISHTSGADIDDLDTPSYGHAEMLGTEEFVKEVNEIAEGFDIMQSSFTGDYPAADLLYVPEMAAESVREVGIGVETVGKVALNRFIYITDRGGAGTGYVYFDPEDMAFEDDQPFVVSTKDGGIDLSVSIYPEADAELHRSVMIAAKLVRELTLLPIKGSLLIKSDVPLKGYSATLAIIECLFGHSHRAMLSGAFLPPDDYGDLEPCTPSQLEAKLAHAVRNNTILIVSVDPRNLDASNLEMALRQRRGVFTTKADTPGQMRIYEQIMKDHPNQRMRTIREAMEENDEVMVSWYNAAKKKVTSTFSDAVSYDEYVIARTMDTVWLAMAMGIGKRNRPKQGIVSKGAVIEPKLSAAEYRPEYLNPNDRIQYNTGGSSGTFTVQELISLKTDPQSKIEAARDADIMDGLIGKAESPLTPEQRVKALKRLANLKAMMQLEAAKRSGAGGKKQTTQRKTKARQGLLARRAQTRARARPMVKSRTETQPTSGSPTAEEESQYYGQSTSDLLGDVLDN